ncbi:DNA glycosylase/AP lyase ROS1 [Daucus carota subsp. sativus]|uniref:DNA glycosylase/AP lyase ROS1 n=1 Tax=Daucus carota subsp. sativus TaxID=79200 RepID=UPI003083985A
METPISHTSMQQKQPRSRQRKILGIQVAKSAQNSNLIDQQLISSAFFLAGSSPGAMLSVDALADHLRLLDINAERKQGANPNTSAGSCNSARCQEQNTLVVYQRDGTLMNVKEQTPRPRVKLDQETIRVWNLLLQDINSEGINGNDEETKKWWEDERRTFNARANSFIKCMHLIQGDRTFSRWKGSVVDSVVGVFLTQNVTDHLSRLAGHLIFKEFDTKTCKSNHGPLVEEVMNVPVSNPEDTPKEMKSKQPTLNERSVIIQEIDCDKNREVLNSNEPCVSRIDSGEVAMSSGLHREGTEVLWREEIGSSQGTARCSVDIVCQPQTSSPNLKNEVESIDKEKIYQVESVDFERNTGTLDVTGATGVFDESKSSSCLSENIKNARASCHVQRHRDSHSKPNGKTYKPNKGRKGKGKQPAAEWDSFRKQAQAKPNGVRLRTPNTMDSVDWEAVRLADIDEVAQIIRDRGMNNVLAERIKEFLDRLVTDHGSIDLEWLRDVPPDKAKEYLLSIRGLGLKSVECVRLLTLHHVAFPVDTNVGRIAVRLGWVPLQPLPESLQLHLLEMYPVLSSIQKYLWPRLCKLDQRTLYELHYQMITFGKVFCTKNKPNCNACPLRGECRHFASAFASARLALPGPEKRNVETTECNVVDQNFVENIDRLQLPVSLSDQLSEANTQISHCLPIIEEPASPGPIIELPATPEAEREQELEDDIEDFFSEDPDDIPTINLNIEEFTQTLQEYIQQNMDLRESDVSKSLVALTPEAASIPAVKLKTTGRLRTEHQVYELPDTHPLLNGLEQRESDDPCSYLLAIWTPGETADSIQPPTGPCSNQESGSFCDDNTCFACSSTREAQSQTVRGTLLIPCRTAMRGSFPLNGTYFQVNEVFADHASSLRPLEVPRYLLWNLPRKTVYFGTSVTAIFRGMSMKDIQLCFWRGYVCVRGFDRESRAPKPLIARLHFPPSKLSKGNEKKEKE